MKLNRWVVLLAVVVLALVPASAHGLTSIAYTHNVPLNGTNVYSVRIAVPSGGTIAVQHVACAKTVYFQACDAATRQPLPGAIDKAVAPGSLTTTLWKNTGLGTRYVTVKMHIYGPYVPLATGYVTSKGYWRVY